MHLEILSKEVIKPSHPTPPNKRILSSSVLDQFAPHIFNGLVFFYENNGLQLPINSPAITMQLKRSLSNCLSHYYPFAGRLREEGHIECTDEGIELTEAHSNLHLLDFLENPQLQALSKLLPISGAETLKGTTTRTLVVIQITKFECGGISIGACFSHKIADACSIATFMKDWAALTRMPCYEPLPRFDGATFFPPLMDKIENVFSKLIPASQNCSTQRLVFDVTKIDAIRNKDDDIGGIKSLRPTRFETIAALICKSILGARTALGLVELNIVNVIVNLRKKMAPRLSEQNVGNFAMHNLINIQSIEEKSLHRLVTMIKEEMVTFSTKYEHQINSEYERSAYICSSYKDLGQLLANNDTEMIMFSSWCRFPFYDVDFGCGKPTWVSMVPNPTTNCIFLCDDRFGDGIEAWVNLEDQVMALFEHDMDFLSVTSVNPSPLSAIR